jgi:surface antigen
MQSRYFLLSLCSIALVIAGCQNMQNKGDKELIGTGAGAVIGGILGSEVGGGSGKLWATGAGTLIGALVGSEIGKSLDRADRAALQQANNKAREAPVGETITWKNPETGHHGSVTPVREGENESGRYCREFRQKIIVDGREQTGYGTACQQPDGSWKIVN